MSPIDRPDHTSKCSAGAARDILTLDESIEAIWLRYPRKFDTDFPYLLSMLHDSLMSRRNNIAVPGSKMGLALEIFFAPTIQRLMDERSGG